MIPRTKTKIIPSNIMMKKCNIMMTNIIRKIVTIIKRLLIIIIFIMLCIIMGKKLFYEAMILKKFTKKKIMHGKTSKNLAAKRSILVLEPDHFLGPRL